MNSDDLRAIRDETGVPYMSLYAIRIAIRQLQRAGLPRERVVSVLESIHPRLMKNLKMDVDWNIVLKKRSMIWKRQRGWVAQRT
jgi:hypothetical protein